MSSRLGFVAASFIVLLAACAQEITTPLDLDATILAPEVSEAPEVEDPNLAARDQMEDLAKEECRKDPSREVGVVVVTDSATGEEVSRFEFPCDELAE